MQPSNNQNQNNLKHGVGAGKGKGKSMMHFPNTAKQNQELVPVSKQSSHKKAGLQFSVSRVAKFMKQGRYADRIGGGAPVYAAAAL